MEPSFWCWEKPKAYGLPLFASRSRNGAQLLELGKAEVRPQPRQERPGVAMEPSFWSWEKQPLPGTHLPPAQTSQWSPAFGAGKSHSNNVKEII